MEIYLTEQEQIEALKRWWKNYGAAALLGIVVALVGSYGWRHWQMLQERNYLHASMYYEQLLTQLANNDSAMSTSAEYLIKHYPRTYYAKLASLLLARDAVNKNNYSNAETHLSWVVDTAHDPALRQMARIRLARVLLADNKSQEALKTLNIIDDSLYLPLIEDVKGDIFVAQGNSAQAKISYTQALQNAPELVSIYPLLQMKLDNLNGSALAGTAL